MDWLKGKIIRKPSKARNLWFPVKIFPKKQSNESTIDDHQPIWHTYGYIGWKMFIYWRCLKRPIKDREKLAKYSLLVAQDNQTKLYTWQWKSSKSWYVHMSFSERVARTRTVFGYDWFSLITNRIHRQLYAHMHYKYIYVLIYSTYDTYMCSSIVHMLYIYIYIFIAVPLLITGIRRY